MTEYEIAMTVLFGYLTAAYFIGANLTKVQVSIFTSLYIVFLVLAFIGIMTTSQAWMNAIDAVTEADPTLVMADNFAFKEITNAAIFGLGIASGAASLYFMWSVRHPKK
jgi:hypothetical protein